MTDYHLTIECETRDHTRYIAKDTTGKIVARNGRVDGIIDLLSRQLPRETRGQRLTIATEAGVPTEAAKDIVAFVNGYNFLHRG